jgi:hypothetical protein
MSSLQRVSEFFYSRWSLYSNQTDWDGKMDIDGKQEWITPSSSVIDLFDKSVFLRQKFN